MQVEAAGSSVGRTNSQQNPTQLEVNKIPVSCCFSCLPEIVGGEC